LTRHCRTICCLLAAVIIIPVNPTFIPCNNMAFCRRPSCSRTSNILDKFQFFSLSTQPIARVASISQKRICGPFYPKRAKLWSLKWTSPSQCPDMKREDFYSNNRKLQLGDCRWGVFWVGRHLLSMFSRSESERLTYPLYDDREHPCHILGWVSPESSR
jgi:hypothetical protein